MNRNATMDEMLVLLMQESRKRRRWKRGAIATGLLLIVLILAFEISMQEVTFHTIFALLAPLGLLSIGVDASLKERTAARAILEFDDLRIVGPLAEALDITEDTIGRLAEEELIRLLPRLKASDAHLLDPTQRACLNRALCRGNTALTLAILKAWEQVGDTFALTTVERLAEGHRADREIAPGNPLANRKDRSERIQRLAAIWDRFCCFWIGRRADIVEADRPQIVAAAQECLPILRQSVENRSVSSQLLRAADAVAPAADSLLRAALPQSSSAPAEQLLRPTDRI